MRKSRKACDLKKGDKLFLLGTSIGTLTRDPERDGAFIHLYFADHSRRDLNPNMEIECESA